MTSYSINRNSILLLLAGCLMLSPFSNTIFKDILHFPTALPELLLILLLIIKKKSFSAVIHGCRNLRCYVLLWTMLLLIALVVDNYSSAAVIAHSRTWLYLLLLISYSYKNFTKEDVLFLSLGSLVGWFLATCFSVRLILTDGEFVGTTGNLLAIPLFITIAISQKNRLTLWIGLFLIMIICIASGVRRPFIVLLLTIILTIFRNKLSDAKFLVKTILLIVLSYIFIGLILPYVKSAIYEISPFLYARTFERYNTDFDENDLSRVEMLESLFDLQNLKILPNGFFSSRVDIDGTGIFIDMPILGLIYIFGSLITVFILFYFTSVIGRLIRRFHRYRNVEYFVYSTSLIICMCMLFFEGSFLSSLYVTPLTGICIGKAISLTKNNKIYE